jgi:hypothetical protein
MIGVVVCGTPAAVLILAVAVVVAVLVF